MGAAGSAQTPVANSTRKKPYNNSSSRSNALIETPSLPPSIIAKPIAQFHNNSNNRTSSLAAELKNAAHYYGISTNNKNTTDLEAEINIAKQEELEALTRGNTTYRTRLYTKRSAKQNANNRIRHAKEQEEEYAKRLAAAEAAKKAAEAKRAAQQADFFRREAEQAQRDATLRQTQIKANKERAKKNRNASVSHLPEIERIEQIRLMNIAAAIKNNAWEKYLTTELGYFKTTPNYLVAPAKQQWSNRYDMMIRNQQQSLKGGRRKSKRSKQSKRKQTRRRK